MPTTSDPPPRRTIRTLRSWARRTGAFLAGVVGFSGSWKRNPRPDAEAITARVLERLFRDASAGDAPVWCVSGATDFGVPAIAYRVAGDLGLCRVGITAEQAFRYPLAELDRLTVIGERFGDESEAFVRACNVVWMIGGGPQSEREVRLAHRLGKPVVVVQGLGGQADALTPEELPNATFVQCDDLVSGAGRAG